MGEKKLHYKMYKDGKKLVFAAIATLSFFVFGGVSTVAVHADTTSGNLTAATVNSTSDTKSAVSSAATVASSSSATNADSTSASSNSAVKAETTSNDKPVVVTTIASSSASSASVSTAASEATVTTTSTVPTDTTVATSGSSTSLSSAVDNAKSAGVNVNETAASQYSGTSATSEAVADYASQVASIDTAAKDYQDAKAKYQGEQDIYQEKLKQYNTAKSAYDDYQKEVTSGTQVGKIDRANNLVLTSEPNATVSVEGTTNYITPDAVKRLGIGGNDKSIIDQYNTSALTDSDLTRTDPYSNSQDQIILMKVGDTVTATYDNLSNTSYTQDDGSSKKIAKIVYTYTLKSSSNNAQTAIVDIIRDPTVTITVGSNTETNNPISMDMGIKFYYEDGTQVDFSDGKAIVSLSSLNHWNGTQYLPNEKPQAITLQANDNNGKTVQVQWNPYQSNEGPTQTNGRIDVVSENLQHLFAGKNVTLSDTNPVKFVIDGTVSDVTSYVAKDANGNQYDTTGQTIGKYTLTNGTVTYTPNFKYDQSDHVEKVGIGKNTFVYLPGSSITNQNGTVYSVGNNEYVSKGAKLNAESIGSEAAGTYIPGWDYPQSKTAYYGSGALILTDGNINFSVGGNSIGQHNNTVMWFAMNANINTPKDPGDAPTAPVAPTAPTVEWHENQVVQTQQVSVTNASRTINYTYANGPKAGQTAADSVVNNATFATVTDSATGETTTYVFDGTKSQSDVNAEVQNTSDIVSALTNLGFTKADSTQFNQVDSPSIPGYTADKTSVEAANVNKDYGNQTIDVKYNIDTQTAKVSIIDETDNDKNLYSETLTGDSGSEINFGTADEQLKNYLANGYALSTDRTSDNTGDSFTPADFDYDSNQYQVFNVYLVHTYTNHDKDNPGTGYDKSDFEKTVTRTIDYTYGNGPKQGQTAAPTVTQNVDFTRNIVTDNVTGKEVQSGGGYTTTDWKATGDDKTWAQVDSPAIASYTPSQTSVAEVTPTADTLNTDVHVVYTIGAQKATINIIDETDGDKNLWDATETGDAGSVVNFNDADTALKNYLANGYALSTNKTSDATADGFTPADYDADSSVDQVFNVYLVHTYTNHDKDNPGTGYDKSDFEKTVTRTIDYTYGNGPKQEQTAAPTVTQNVDFTRNIVTDNVTGKEVQSGGGYTTTDWKATGDDKTWAQVDSPAIASYTPSQTSVAEVTPTADTLNTDVHVVYTIGAQKATINIIDETDGDKNLWDATETGDAGSVVNFNDADTALKNYLANGYALSTNKTSDATADGFTPADYDADSSVDQVFNVYLVHTYTNHDKDNPGTGYDKSDFEKTVTRTIDYTYGNGPKQEQTAAPTVTQNVDFTRNIVTDNVTGKEVQSGGGYTTTDWKATGDDKTWAQVDSPAIASYTPSQTSVAEVTPTADTLNTDVHVVYTIGAQKATINIIDETDGDKNLWDATETGDAGSVVNFNDADTALKNYLANGYALSTNKTSDATADGFTPADYDADSSVDQVFNVYLVHTYTNHDKDNPGTGYDKSDFEKTVTRTIDYTYGNGPKQEQTAAPTVTQNVDFTRNIVTDNVTGKEVQSGGGYTTTDWKATGDDKTWAQVDSPAIASYTPSQTSVAEVTPTADTLNADVHVVYTIGAQKATINIIDETDGDKNLWDATETGDAGSVVNFNDADTALKNYLANGYALSTNKTSDATADGFTPADYDADSSVDQVFNVYLIHTYTNRDKDNPGTGYDKSDFEKTVTRTIDYTYGNGPKQGQTAAPTVTQNVDFTRNIVTDNVTGKEVQSGGGYTTTDWKATGDDKTWAQVDSPAIASYTPSQTSVAEVTPTADTPNTDVHVVYTIGAQKATINIIDETDGDKNLWNATKTGDAGSAVNFNDADAALKNYLANGHALSTNKTSDATADGFTPADYDADSSVDQVFNVYLIHTYTNRDKDNLGTGYDKSDFEKTVTRTIDYTYGNGPKQGQTAAPTVTQNVDFTRNIVTDNVTGKEVQSGGGYTTTDWKATGDDTTWAQVDSPAIASYTPSQTSVAEVTPTADTPNTDVHVVYTKNAPTMTTEKKTVNETVSYVDQNGNVLAQPHTASVDFTRQVSTDAVTGEKTYGSWSADQSFAAVTSPELKGYTADKAQIDKQTVNGDSKDLEFTVTYTKTPVAGGNVTAKYVDENGNPIADDVIASGNVGDPYSTTQKDVPGYTFKEVQGNPTGSFTDQDQTVTYVYTKNPATDNNGGTGLNQPGKPGNGTDTGNSGSNQPGNPSQPSNATNNGVINKSTNTGSKVNNGAVNSPELPQTGENNSQSQTMSFIGILLAMFGSLLGFLGIKKRRND